MISPLSSSIPQGMITQLITAKAQETDLELARFRMSDEEKRSERAFRALTAIGSVLDEIERTNKFPEVTEFPVRVLEVTDGLTQKQRFELFSSDDASVTELARLFAPSFEESYFFFVREAAENLSDFSSSIGRRFSEQLVLGVLSESTLGGDVRVFVTLKTSSTAQKHLKIDSSARKSQVIGEICGDRHPESLEPSDALLVEEGEESWEGASLRRSLSLTDQASEVVEEVAPQRPPRAFLADTAEGLARTLIPELVASGRYASQEEAQRDLKRFQEEAATYPLEMPETVVVRAWSVSPNVDEAVEELLGDAISW